MSHNGKCCQKLPFSYFACTFVWMFPTFLKIQNLLKACLLIVLAIFTYPMLFMRFIFLLDFLSFSQYSHSIFKRCFFTLIVFSQQGYSKTGSVAHYLSRATIVLSILRIISSIFLHQIYHMNYMNHINPWISLLKKHGEVMCKKR